MKLKMMFLALLSLSSFAWAQEYSMRQANIAQLKLPRADMAPSIFAAHAAFVDLVQSTSSIKLSENTQGRPQMIVNLNHGGTVVFQRIENRFEIFEADISATPMAAYPEGRLLLSLDNLKPTLLHDDSPVRAITLYIVGKFPFAHWGYGDVDSPKLYSEAKWVRHSVDYLGTRVSTYHCNPRFPCNPEVFYRYRATFENSLTAERFTEIQELDRRL